MNTSYAFLAALALLIHATNAAPAPVNVDWVVKDYAPITVEPGQNVIFTFSSAHNLVEAR